MTLLILFGGADFTPAPVIPDAAGLAYAEEVMLYGMALDETPLYASANDENATHGIQLDEVR